MLRKAYLVFLVCLLTVLGCTNKHNQMTQVNAKLKENIKNTHTTTYEVFLYSYYDSDGDGIGDINGLIEKLPYIDEMGYTSIWLMPIMPSSTYHKYDVDDYYNIDPQYGTLDDFKHLIEECKKYDLHIIIDLVLNHTSSDHPWFKEARDYLLALNGKEAKSEECKYIDYYHFSDTFQNGYAQVNDSWLYYEARFWDRMPDLNLDNPNVRNEIKDIMQYWLDLGVDGFRLDAVTYYYTGNSEANIAFLRWLNDTAKLIKEDCYIVGEAWTNQNEIAQLYESGIDSLFDFPFASVDGIIHDTTLRTKGIDAYVQAQIDEDNLFSSKNPNYINAPFYTNHDLARSTGYYAGDDGRQVKFAGALNLLMSGNAFVYYGEEIGMKGAGKDENKRAPMQWSKTDPKGMCHGPLEMESFEMKFDDLETQIKDEDSIYSYFKNAIKIRNAFPSIANGKIEMIKELSDEKIAVYQKYIEDETVYIVINASEELKEIDLSSLDVKQMSAILSATGEEIKYKNQKGSIPSYGIAIFE